MKIAYVLKKFPRLSETFILNEVLGLEALGHEVVIFSLRPADDEPRHEGLRRLKAEVQLVPKENSMPWSEAEGRSRELLQELPAGRRQKTWAQGMAVAELCARHEGEQVHAHFMTVASHVAALARLAGGPPFTVTAHAKDIFRNGINQELFRCVAALSSGIVTVSEFNQRYITERFFGGGEAPVTVIYNGLPLDEFANGARPVRREPDLILGVGRLVQKKGFDVLIKACSLLRDMGKNFRLVLIGDGDERGRLEELIHREQLGSQITLTGALPREKVIEHLHRARLMALPCCEGSDGNRDALPTVLIECLACGLPAVSTRLVGIPEIIRDGENGLLSAPGDTKAVALAMAKLLDEDALWQRCSDAGPPRARALFDRAQTLPRLVQVFASCAVPLPEGGAGA